MNIYISLTLLILAGLFLSCGSIIKSSKHKQLDYVADNIYYKLDGRTKHNTSFGLQVKQELDRLRKLGIPVESEDDYISVASLINLYAIRYNGIEPQLTGEVLKLLEQGKVSAKDTYREAVITALKKID